MENMTLEQLIATFGEEVGKQMHAQMTAGQGGGAGAPFPFLKKVSTHGSEVGVFGDFAFGVKTEKDQAGNKTIVDKGTNVGTSFEFIIVNVCYRYTLWDEGKQKSYRSNIFTSLDGIKTAVDSYTGKALPTSKDAKKAAGWKLNRINAGLVRANSKAEWTPVIWETAGTLYFTLGEVVGKQANGGLLSGVVKIATKLDSKGSTQYSVIDVAKSSFGALPKDLFTNDATKTALSDITTKMTEYQKSNQYDASASPAPAQAPAPAASSDNDDDTDW